MASFILGAFIGCAVCLFALAICTIAKESDDEKRFTFGQKIWFVDRSEFGDPISVFSLWYIAKIGNVALLFVNNKHQFSPPEILSYFLQETRGGWGVHLEAVWLKDCFTSEEAARAALICELKKN